MQKFILATHNAHKVEEFSRILAPLGVEVCTADLPEVDETGTTFEENAYLKAASACEATGLPAIADDSGLCVHALNGEPGVHSARWAGEVSDKVRNRLLLERLKEVPASDRLAKFVSVICCVFPSDGERPGDILTARGECEGAIAFAPAGEDGFGYDPIFLCGEKTYAEMTGAEKDAVSHRGRALRRFCAQLEQYQKTHQI